MDWYLSGGDGRALRELRHEVGAYLARHAAPGAEVADAELVVEELVSNAVKHAGGPVWVSLTWQELSPTIRVLDLGPGFDPALLGEVRRAPLDRAPDTVAGPDWLDDLDEAERLLMGESGRGLFLVATLSESLEASVRDHGGMVVSAVLPVKKRDVLSHDPPRRSVGALPLPEDANPDGSFGKEPFLRALVVQLAHAVDFQHGPDAAEAAVAQVGADVGGRMEEAYRAAQQVVGRLTPEQIADCYVRLKHAIEGGFTVVEVASDKVVLVNDRCPFGRAVQSAPALCRMTSSVFGGIAARNSPEGAGVLLEERIALGDPGCRVVVFLGEPPAGVAPYTHRYQHPA
ncbi:ATP-binding protein [Aquipuribacter nitratireducens]|uniref:ATP-binding protein n=1 Tax=Aquipuribacter nitratireducens TaxID=650104 RepID=A0ABW0GM32_9MICO